MVGISPIAVLLTDLYVTGRPEPAWFIPYLTMVLAWHGMRSSLPAFVAMLDSAASPRLATRALVFVYGTGLVVSVAAFAAGTMLH